MSKELYVWGTGGHAKSLAEIAMASGFQIQAFISPNSDYQTFLGFNAYPDLPGGLAPKNAVIAIGIGDNFTRQKVWLELNKTYPISMFPPLIHPTASIAKDSEDRARIHGSPELRSWNFLSSRNFLHPQHSLKYRTRLCYRRLCITWPRGPNRR